MVRFNMLSSKWLRTLSTWEISRKTELFAKPEGDLVDMNWLLPCKVAKKTCPSLMIERANARVNGSAAHDVEWKDGHVLLTTICDVLLTTIRDCSRIIKTCFGFFFWQQGQFHTPVAYPLLKCANFDWSVDYISYGPLLIEPPLWRHFTLVW